MSTVTDVQAAPGPLARLPGGRPARRRDGAADRRRTRCRRSPRRRSRATAPARSSCRSPSRAWVPPTATRAACRSGISTRSPPASRYGPAGIRCRTAPSTTTTSARSSSRCSMRGERSRDDRELGGDEPVSVQEYSAYFGELLGVDATVRGRGDPRRVARLGGRPHQAQRDHRPVPGRLARGVSPPGASSSIPTGSSGSDRRMIHGAGTCAVPERASALMAEAMDGDRPLRLRPGRLSRGSRRAAREPRARRRSEPGDRRRGHRRSPSAPGEPPRGRGVVPRTSGDRGAPMRGPIDINGLPRTGTTALANMMSLDPQFRCLAPVGAGRSRARRRRARVRPPIRGACSSIEENEQVLARTQGDAPLRRRRDGGGHRGARDGVPRAAVHAARLRLSRLVARAPT